MEEKCLENSDVIEQSSAKIGFPEASNNSDENCVSPQIQAVKDQSLGDIVLNFPSTSRSSMSLLQEEEFGNSQHDFAEVLDEDTTTSGVLETFEISSSNSLPTCSDTVGDVAVVEDSSSADAVKMSDVSTVASVDTSRNNSSKFFNEPEIYVINDDEDDDDDDVAVVITNEIESETPATGNQLNGIISGAGGQTIFLETPVVEEQQQQHHSNNLMGIVSNANDTASVPNRLSDEFMLADDIETNGSNVLIVIDNSNDIQESENDQDDDEDEDDDDDEDEEEEDEEVEEEENRASLTDKNFKNSDDIKAPVSDAAVGKANVAAFAAAANSFGASNETGTVTGRIKSELGSTVEGNAERMSFRLKNMSINNSTSQDNSAGRIVTIDELPSGSNGLIDVTIMADIQSMDLIERRDFETEQRLTGGIILKSSSLINKNLLNPRLVKQTQQNQGQNLLQHSQQQHKSQEETSHITIGRGFFSDSKCTYKEPLTTPTSSRTYNSRLTKSTAKLSMSFSLSQQNDCERSQPSTSTSTSSSVIVEPPTTSNSSANSASGVIGGAERSFLSVNNCQQNQQERLNSGCSRTSALFSAVAASTASNAIAINDDLEPSTSARCQFTPLSKASSIRFVNHASAQTIERHLSRSGITRTISPNAAGPSGTTSMPLIAPGSLRSRRRAEAAALAARSNNSDNFIAAFKAVAEAATTSSDSVEIIDDDPWVDCEENTSSDIEEVCTCPHRSDSESSHSSNTTLNEEELEVSLSSAALYRDGLDLPSYLHTTDEANYVDGTAGDNGLAATSQLTSSGVTGIQLQQRKRKYNEGRLLENDYSSGCSIVRVCASGNDGCSGIGPNMAGGDANCRKRIAYDFTSTPRSTYGNSSLAHTTPTTSQLAVSPYSSPLGRRTPRSVIPTRENPPPELQNWLAQFQRWTHAERLLAVDRLIGHCEPTQVRHMMKVIEPQFQRDFISLLPRELALQVLAYLDPKDLLRAAQTCRSWRFLCDDNLLWKEKCRKAQILTEPLSDRPKRGCAGNMPPIASPWKAAYMRQHIIEMNWRSRPIREPKVLKGHDEHVITCLQFSGNRIVSGSDDNTLKVWSAVTGRCLRTLVGHTGGVWSSQMSGNIIISGSTDRTLKVWDMENGRCIHTLMGHTSTVRCMHLHGKKVVSGSRDATLRVWDIEQGSCLHVLVGHLAAVRCVQYDGRLIVSGAYDYMVKIWHPERQECLHTLQGHTNRVYSLQFDGIHVVSGSLDTSIRVWDVETGNCKHTLMGHQSLTSGMELRQNILVSGNADSTVKVWDITTGQCLQTLSGPNKHQSAVTCLQFNSRFVVTSSDDGTVKLWDVKTGEFIRNLVSLESGGSGGVVWRIRANDTKLICAVGSRNGTEETKLLVLDFDVEGACVKCS